MAIRDELKSKRTPPAVQTASSETVPKKKGILPKKGDSKSELIQKAVFLAAVVILLVSGYILFDYFRQGWEAKRHTQELSNKYNAAMEQSSAVSPAASGADDAPEDTVPELLPAAQALLEINPDTVGWVEIADTNIALPVVQIPDDPKGNSYYLNHNFYGEKKQAGAIFADYRNKVTALEQSDNILLYGHNEDNDTMFGDLDKYKQDRNGAAPRWTENALEFYKTHPTFTFNTNYETATYKIFAYFVTSVEESLELEPLFDYNNYLSFPTQARYDEFMENIQKRNMIATDIDCQYGDKFVTLSTCSNEYSESRLVVFGRKVRPGESPFVNTAAVQYAQAPLEPDWDAIYGRK